MTALAVLLAAAPGCETERPETPTKGHVTVVVSESVAPMMKVEEQVFEQLYPQAHVDIEVASDREAIARLFNDSITVIVSARPLNAEELEVKKRFRLQVHDHLIAIDAVAVIINNENPLRQLRTTALDSILTGKVTRWSELGGKTSGSPIAVVLPDINNAAYEVVGMSVLHGGRYLPSAKVVATSPELIQAVVKDPSAIGIVGMSWLKDRAEQVRQVELSDPNAPDSLGTRGKFYAPFQAYVYQRYYPITRNVYIYSTADNYGVAAGFTSFITSGPGQKIVLNSGLVPATMPVRLVETTNKPLQ
jgi:phosphate transport system substrate-binding protein